MIDVRIMAHPSRSDGVRYILDRLSLPESVVSWDDRPNGGDATYTARKAWLAPMPEGCTHRLVLQDDIEICDNFLEIAEKVAARHDRHIVSFFHIESYESGRRYNPTRKVWGQATMMPAGMVGECWEHIDYMVANPSEYPRNLTRHDTVCIRLWAEEFGIPVINTSPSLVQHVGDVSLVGIEKRRVAPDYMEHPPIEGW